MRKMMNKKGFSLVELMIVVVIMGILIAVAIPLYGAITDNANNKTCANNIKAIKNNAANYKATWNVSADNTTIKDTFDGGDLPECPLAEAGENGVAAGAAYTLDWSAGDGSVKVTCPYAKAGTFHTAAKTGSATELAGA